MSGLSEEQLAEIRAREAAASNGPWNAYRLRDGSVVIFGLGRLWNRLDGGGVEERPDTLFEAHDGTPEDAEFIAHAREDVPALLDLAEEQAREIERLLSERHSTNEALDDAVQAIAAKDARIAELEAAEHVDWRAWHDSDASMPLGQYTGRDAAMGHVHHVLAREESISVEAIGLRVRWVADDPHGPEDEPTAWECWLTDADGEDEQPTGYVVSPIEVAAAYDPDGDE